MDDFGDKLEKGGGNFVLESFFFFGNWEFQSVEG